MKFIIIINGWKDSLIIENLVLFIIINGVFFLKLGKMVDSEIRKKRKLYEEW